MSSVEEVLIGVGSNLNGPAGQISTAVSAIGDIQSVNILAQSSLYRSSPQGPQNQNDYVNAVVMICTQKTPTDLLMELQKLELRQGRVKTRHWGERVIDLDILFFGRQIVTSQSPDLQIPHSHALKRDFVVIPTLEIAPKWLTPDGTPLSEFKNQCLDHKLKIIT